MWIRSQDKEIFMDFSGFLLFEGINSINKNWKIQVQDDNNTIIAGTNNSRLCDLGIYKTKERALEILNDIQKEIANCLPANKDQYNIVFEMPKE